MHKYYLMSLFRIACSSCTTIEYLGNSASPTDSVAFFVDPNAVPQPYTIMGKGYVRRLVQLRRLQARSISLAKAKGADAVLIQDYITPPVSGTLNTMARTDSFGKGTITLGTGSINMSSNQEFVVLFLKYK